MGRAAAGNRWGSLGWIEILSHLWFSLLLVSNKNETNSLFASLNHRGLSLKRNAISEVDDALSIVLRSNVTTAPAVAAVNGGDAFILGLAWWTSGPDHGYRDACRSTTEKQQVVPRSPGQCEGLLRQAEFLTRVSDVNPFNL